MLQIIAHHLHYSLRMLRKSPGLTAAVLITLMLGIGATTAVYTVVYAALVAPLPYPEPQQLTVVWSRVGGHRNGISAGDFLDWRAQSTSFQGLTAWTGHSFNLATNEQPEQVPGRLVTPGYFNLQGFSFLAGRDFLPSEGIPGGEHVAILTHQLWSRLGSVAASIGKQLRVDGVSYTIAGVLAPGVADRLGAELIAPLAFTPDQINHNYHWLLAIGRLKPGVSIEQAQRDMDGVTRRIAEAFPRSNKGWGASVEPLQDDFLPRERVRNLWLLLGAVGFVLLITCVNIANLLLSRGATRQREIAVRSSLGASRGTIFAQFLTESLLLACAGGALGVWLGSALLRGIVSLVPENILPSEADFSLDRHVLLVAVAMTMLSGVIFGCAPAWYASRVDPVETLKRGGRAGTSSGSHRLRRLLIVSEFALALSLLAGAGLAIASFWKLTRIDLGVRTEHVLTFRLNQPKGRFATAAQMNLYNQQILQAVRSTSGVLSAATVTGMPLEFHSDGMGFTIVGSQRYTDPSMRPDTGFQSISPDYLRTFGIQLLQERTFTDQDTAASVHVAIVNQEFVKRYLKGLDPLKQRVLIDDLVPNSQQTGRPVEWQIVGVTHNVLYGDFREPGLELSVPFAQSPLPDITVGVRTALDPSRMAHTIAMVVHSIDPNVALARVRTMDQVKTEALGEDRFTMRLFAAFAGLALLLAAVGLYGLMSYSVSQRTHEIGIRLALGARREGITGLVLREALQLAGFGLAHGLGGALLVGRAMQTTLYGVAALDPAVTAAVASLLLLTALIASSLPALRAATVDPIQALRND